jgi:hypothetical protein
LKQRTSTHDAATEAAQAPALSRRDALLVASALTPPAAWSLALLLNYALVYPAARLGDKGLLWAVTAGTETLVVIAGLIGAHTLRTVVNVDAGARPRTRAMAITTCSLSALFAIAIAAQIVPIVYLGLREP